MKQKTIAITALAVAAAFLPSYVQARDKPQTSQAGSLSLLPPIALAPKHTEKSELAAAPFNFRLIGHTAIIKTRSMSHDWQNDSLALNMMRAKSQRK